jgi:hypothetical protein
LAEITKCSVVQCFSSIKLILRAVPWARRLLPLPDFSSRQPTREWIANTIKVAIEFFSNEDSENILQVLFSIQNIIRDDSSWDILWLIMQKHFYKKTFAHINESDSMKTLSDKHGVSIETIISILISLIGLLKKG